MINRPLGLGLILNRLAVGHNQLLSSSSILYSLKKKRVRESLDGGRRRRGRRWLRWRKVEANMRPLPTMKRDILFSSCLLISTNPSLDDERCIDSSVLSVSLSWPRSRSLEGHYCWLLNEWEVITVSYKIRLQTHQQAHSWISLLRSTTCLPLSLSLSPPHHLLEWLR